MLKITIIAVGKLKERFWKEAVSEYLKRLQPYARVIVIEIQDAPDSLGTVAACEREGEAILRALPEGAFTILMDSRGKQLTSEELAHKFDQMTVSGVSHVAFIIGGSNGVSHDLRRATTDTLSLGKITLPHNLARVVLVEQIYRAFKISRNEPYHK